MTRMDLSLDLPTLKKIQENFLVELQNANAGKKTSLPFIVHELPYASLVQTDEVFQVLVIGGSMCKSALVKKTKDSIKILSHEEKPQPPFITKGDLFRFIDNELSKDVTMLALNFAYPLEPVFENGKLDGKLVAGSKENTFIGLVGEKVGSSIEDYIQQQRKQKIQVSVANDTICLLLSGLIQNSWENLAAGIVGTGLNFAIFLDGHHLVNLESANFDKFSQSEEGKEIDALSSTPGKALFEKETSGAYLYRHFNAILKKDGYDFHELTSTWELKTLAFKNIPKASQLAQKLIKRSAELVACQIGGITLFKERNMVFVMDGSFFWGEDIYKNHVADCLKNLIPNYSVRFIQIPNTTIIGAAKLVA